MAGKNMCNYRKLMGVTVKPSAMVAISFYNLIVMPWVFVAVCDGVARLPQAVAAIRANIDSITAATATTIERDAANWSSADTISTTTQIHQQPSAHFMDIEHNMREQQQSGHNSRRTTSTGNSSYNWNNKCITDNANDILVVVMGSPLATVRLNGTESFRNENQIAPPLVARTPTWPRIIDELTDHRQSRQHQHQEQHQKPYDLLLSQVVLEKTQRNRNDTAITARQHEPPASLTRVDGPERQQQQWQGYQQQQAGQILSRHKRYLSFPEGSSFSVAVCFTVGIIGNPNYSYMSYGLNWGVAYDLPNTSWVLNHLHGFGKHTLPPPTAWRVVQRRRSRRSVYQQIEMFIDNMGYNGRDCVLRALCESRHYFQRTKMTMVGEMLRAVFSLPKQRLFTRELRDNEDIVVYDRAYRKARSTDCEQEYDCKFSLLELAFGKYSQPPAGYYANH